MGWKPIKFMFPLILANLLLTVTILLTLLLARMGQVSPLCVSSESSGQLVICHDGSMDDDGQGGQSFEILAANSYQPLSKLGSRGSGD